MNKILLIILVSGCLAVSQNAAAIPFQANVGNFLMSQQYNSQPMTGGMVSGINNRNFAAFGPWSTSYSQNSFQSNGPNHGFAGSANSMWHQITWLYSNFAPGTHTQQSGLQSPFWMLTSAISSRGFPDMGIILATAAAAGNGWMHNGRVFVPVSGRPGGHHVSSAPVPEPATLLLVGIGIIGIATLSRRKFKNPVIHKAQVG